MHFTIFMQQTHETANYAHKLSPCLPSPGCMQHKLCDFLCMTPFEPQRLDKLHQLPECSGTAEQPVADDEMAWTPTNSRTDIPKKYNDIQTSTQKIH